MMKYKVILLLAPCFFMLPALGAQTDCAEQIEDLGTPLKTDSTRIIDPDTYKEKIKITKFYLNFQGKAIEEVYVEDNTSEASVSKRIKTQFLNHARPIKKKVKKGNTYIHYIKIDDCYLIHKTVSYLD